jgi:cell volume regulation protein A
VQNVQTLDEGRIILIGGALLAAGYLGSLVAAWLRLPALLLFLGLGMAIGSDGTGWIDFSSHRAARFIGIVALTLILFEGGLAAGWHEIRPILRPAIGLALVGTVVTAMVTGLMAVWLFGLPLLEGLLLGAVLAGTDGAAVFAMLRGTNLPRRLARTLEGEAGLNDPVAVLLVVGLIDVIIRPSFGGVDLVVLFAEELAIGAVLGIAVGWIGVHAMRRARSAPEGLQLVTSAMTLALAFGAADVLGGSGFLAVYLSGLVIGSVDIPARRAVLAFHEGLASVAEIGMFFALGLLVFPSQLGGIAIRGTALALVVAFLARPLAALLGTAIDGFSFQERLLLGWAGLRGAVPVVLATFPVIAGIPDSLDFFNIVFFAVLVSTLIQGATVEPLARMLGVSQPSRDDGTGGSAP